VARRSAVCSREARRRESSPWGGSGVGNSLVIGALTTPAAFIGVERWGEWSMSRFETAMMLASRGRASSTRRVETWTGEVFDGFFYVITHRKLHGGIWKVQIASRGRSGQCNGWSRCDRTGFGQVETRNPVSRLTTGPLAGRSPRLCPIAPQRSGTAVTSSSAGQKEIEAGLARSSLGSPAPLLASRSPVRWLLPDRADFERGARLHRRAFFRRSGAASAEGRRNDGFLWRAAELLCVSKRPSPVLVR